MKSFVVDFFMNIVVKDNKYGEIKLKEIRYGLEGLYLNISKLIVFLIINALINNLWTSFLFILFFIPIKGTSYGFHAKTSLQCWTISAICFVGLPYLANYISINNSVIILLLIYIFFMFAFFSPADTPRKPILSQIIRFKLRMLSLIVVIIYSYLIFTFNSLTNIIIFVLLFQCLMINPLTYLLFNVQYDNYLYYKRSSG